MSWDDLRAIDRKSLKEKIRKYDTQMWLEGMFQKPTMKWHRIGKGKIEYEMCYINDTCSTYLAKHRSNSPQLEEHLGRGSPNYDTTCKFCRLEEVLEYFIVRCPELEGKRNTELLQGLPITSEEKTIHILYKKDRFQETERMIKDMWNLGKCRRDDLRTP